MSFEFAKISGLCLFIFLKHVATVCDLFDGVELNW